jgi:hypothetical protein
VTLDVHAQVAREVAPLASSHSSAASASALTLHVGVRPGAGLAGDATKVGAAGGAVSSR